MSDQTWRSRAKVDEYLNRIGSLSPRLEGEHHLSSTLIGPICSMLDLGTGDGRLIELVSSTHPELELAVGIDYSEPMLERAEARFKADTRVSFDRHDLARPLPDLGTFDLVISGFAIHHLAHDRKQDLLSEVVTSLNPNGVFANLDVVECATTELQNEFLQLIGRPEGDPEDRLLSVEVQLDYMRSTGLTNVDCFWRWRGFALMIGRRPGNR